MERYCFSSFKMCGANTLQEICAQLIVQNNLVAHPVNNIGPIPPTIYEDLWNLHRLKALTVREKYLQHTISILEQELDDVEEDEEYYNNIWNKVSEELTILNQPNPYDSNPPPAPSLIFFDLYRKAKDITELSNTLEEWVDRKWEQQYENDEDKEQLIERYGYVQFNVSATNQDDEVDMEYDEKVDTLIEEITSNNLTIEIIE